VYAVAESKQCANGPHGPALRFFPVMEGPSQEGAGRWLEASALFDSDQNETIMEKLYQNAHGGVPLPELLRFAPLHKNSL
jgi:hypothetical protein